MKQKQKPFKRSKIAGGTALIFVKCYQMKYLSFYPDYDGVKLLTLIRSGLMLVRQFFVVDFFFEISGLGEYLRPIGKHHLNQPVGQRQRFPDRGRQ